MRVAITGHLGTLGSPLYKRIEEMGHDVVGIDLRHSEHGVRADVADFRQLRNAIPSNTDVVYHLAAEFGRHNGEDFYEQVWKTNAIGTKNVIRLQEELGFKLIFASSSEVYGEKLGATLSEDMVANSPEDLTNDYAISKWVNEGQIRNSAKRHGTESMILRFFNAYGPGEHYHAYRSVVCLFCYRALKGLPYDVYEGYHRVFQYVDDMVDTLSMAMHNFYAGETINVGGVEYRSVHDLHDVVSKSAGVDPHRNIVRHLPEDKHNVVNKRPDINKAINLLGHNPKICLEEGVERTVQWMKSVYG